VDKNSNLYVGGFAITVCVVMAAGLAATFNTLKEPIDNNARFDRQKNVMIATGLYDPAQGERKQAELEAVFREKVEARVIEFFETDVETTVKVAGEHVTKTERQVTRAEVVDIPAADVDRLMRQQRQKPREERRILSELYVADVGGKKVYCVPISGYGLWSTLYGYLALESDLNTVVGITFYQHGETPGLGGEVVADWWTSDWPGKTILDEQGELVGIRVLKGRGNQTEPGGHTVDGISGATITSDGVTEFVKHDLARFEVYFKELRNQ
jgi:Na+-transporting NADH:ubiquinone oxidoreductase subunit C